MKSRTPCWILTCNVTFTKAGHCSGQAPVIRKLHIDGEVFSQNITETLVKGLVFQYAINPVLEDKIL